jgi:hypothetical protein
MEVRNEDKDNRFLRKEAIELAQDIVKIPAKPRQEKKQQQ